MTGENTAPVDATVAADSGSDWSLDTSLSHWKQVLIVGLLFGGVALYVTLVGIVGTFEDRELIEDVVTVGQLVLMVTAIGAGYAGALKAPTGPLNKIIGAAQQAQPHSGGAKVLYAVQGATDPPTFTLFVNRELDRTYLRYLERRLREDLDMGSTPIKLRVRKRS